MDYTFSHTSEPFSYVYASKIRMGSLSNCKPITKKSASTYRFGFNSQEFKSQINTIVTQNLKCNLSKIKQYGI